MIAGYCTYQDQEPYRSPAETHQGYIVQLKVGRWIDDRSAFIRMLVVNGSNVEPIR